MSNPVTAITHNTMFSGHSSQNGVKRGASKSAELPADQVLRSPVQVGYPSSQQALQDISDRYKEWHQIPKTMTVADAKARYPGTHMGKSAGNDWIKSDNTKLKDDDKICVLIAAEETEFSTIPKETLLAMWHPSGGLENAKLPKALDSLQDALNPRLKNTKGMKRFALGVGQRYSDYYHGAQETLGNAKGMGKIFPNLFSTSIGISMTAYGMLYVVQYTANLMNLNHQAALKQAKKSPPTPSAP